MVTSGKEGPKFQEVTFTYVRTLMIMKSLLHITWYYLNGRRVVPGELLGLLMVCYGVAFEVLNNKVMESRLLGSLFGWVLDLTYTTIILQWNPLHVLASNHFFSVSGSTNEN